MIALLLPGVLAAEYRRLELADGRALEVQVLQTTGDGLELAVPPGRLRVGFDQVLSIQEMDQADYTNQPPWRILVRASGDAGVDTQVLAELAAMPGVTVVPGPLPAEEVAGLAACGVDAACVQRSLTPTLADVALVVTTTPNTLSVQSAWTGVGGFLPTGAVPMPTDPASLGLAVSHALHEGLGLLPPPAPLATMPAAWPQPGSPEPISASPAPTPVAPAPTPLADPQPRTRVVNPALAFVPIPGFPEWVAGRPGRAAAATAITLPLTAGLVYVAGAQSREPGALWALSAAGYYALCVTTSRAFLPVVSPTEGGAQVSVGGSF
jgi:hypothetical protein